MWPDRVSNPGPLALQSDALPTAPRGPRVQHLNTLNQGSVVSIHTLKEIISQTD